MRDEGLSLIELTIAMGLLLAITASVFAVLTPAQNASVAEPEAADLQQRLRVAADTLVRDLIVSGEGPFAGQHAGTMLSAFAPLLPFRRTASGGDPPGTFASDVVTTISAPVTAAWTTLASDLAPGETTLQAAREPRCAPGVNLCGFSPGATLLVSDADGSFAMFTLAAVDDASAQLQIASRPAVSSATTFRAGSIIVDAQVHVYALKVDPLTRLGQLVHGDGSANPNVPVVDHIVGLTFEYYGEPRPPALVDGRGDPSEDWTTYGPKPPPLDVARTAYGEGQNCAFQVDESGAVQTPRLADFGAGPTLVKLTLEQLTDGPWCPDPFSAGRWDADLLRIRSVVVTVRVESALAALRGPAGILFANGGTSRTPWRWLPDVERRFVVAPRNLNGAR